MGGATNHPGTISNIWASENSLRVLPLVCDPCSKFLQTVDGRLGNSLAAGIPGDTVPM